MEMSQRDNKTKDILLELIAVAFLATGGIFVKKSGLSPINTGFYRVLISLPLLLPMAGRHFKDLRRKDVMILLLAGGLLAGDVALWNLSFGYTTVANANLLANLTPFTVIPVSYFIFKENIPRFFLVGVLVTMLGVFLLIGGKVNPDPANYFGDFLALCASFFYAAFLLISYRLRDRLASSVIMFVSGIGSVAVLFTAAAAMEGIQPVHNLGQLWPLIGLSVCVQVIGHNLLAHCQGKINVNLSSVICLSQPVIASLYSFVIFGETVSRKEAVGIAIVILGVYLVKWQYRKT